MTNSILTTSKALKEFDLPIRELPFTRLKIEDSFTKLTEHMQPNPLAGALLEELEGKKKKFCATKLFTEYYWEHSISISELACKYYQLLNMPCKKTVSVDAPEEKKSLPQLLLELDKSTQQTETPELIEARRELSGIMTKIFIASDTLRQEMGKAHRYAKFCADARKVADRENQLSLETIKALIAFYAIEAPKLAEYVNPTPKTIGEDETWY